MSSRSLVHKPRDRVPVANDGPPLWDRPPAGQNEIDPRGTRMSIPPRASPRRCMAALAAGDDDMPIAKHEGLLSAAGGLQGGETLRHGGDGQAGIDADVAGNAGAVDHEQPGMAVHFMARVDHALAGRQPHRATGQDVRGG